jgi:LPPG:FO 2-phospho-L-lactate transferase
VLAVPGLKQAMLDGPAPIIGVSPIIAGAAVRGMADRCLATVQVDVSAAGVGALYGARADGGLLDGWLVDAGDADTLVPGVRVRSVPLWMTDESVTAEMVSAAVDLAGEAAP